MSDILGTSLAMASVTKLIARVARTPSTVLVTGETGTGKELVARALHDQSARCDGPFVAINCGAMPESILESELFGHARGAFTGASESRDGLLVEASGGTIFLDEVGDMPMSMQVKLLRALDTRSVRPVGKTQEIGFDARVVAATNRDLETAVEDGAFREDLLFRLNVIRIELPPLCARGGADIALLARHFARREISREAMDLLAAYSWPGNVRELRNAMEHAVALARGDEIAPDDLPPRVRTYERTQVFLASGGDPNELMSMHEMERRYALHVLDAVGGNKSLATRILGWNRKTLYRRLSRWSPSSK
ncbi:MAG TPA: sigma-54 dependent transcriptional regulator [Polyangiaceae bacterium]|jgi:two-component system response regulator HydG|nr:sigma-54 dependent transcriptional regulator [Polyangiaceae bacterium]